MLLVTLRCAEATVKDRADGNDDTSMVQWALPVVIVVVLAAILSPPAPLVVLVTELQLTRLGPSRHQE